MGVREATMNDTTQLLRSLAGLVVEIRGGLISSAWWSGLAHGVALGAVTVVVVYLGLRRRCDRCER